MTKHEVIFAAALGRVLRYFPGMVKREGTSASVLVERERRFQALSSRARSIDIRIDVVIGVGAFAGETLYRPIDLLSDAPVLGADPVANMLRSLDELQVFLDVQFGIK